LCYMHIQIHNLGTFSLKWNLKLYVLLYKPHPTFHRTVSQIPFPHLFSGVPTNCSLRKKMPDFMGWVYLAWKNSST
jgi:hypothetical protein